MIFCRTAARFMQNCAAVRNGEEFHVNAIEPLGEYLASVAAARPEDYAEAIEAGARTAGITIEEAQAEFEEKKSLLLERYEGVQPVGSYRDANGLIFDCVPFDQQPAVRAARRAGLSVARGAPPAPTLKGAKGQSHAPAWVPERVCPEGAVALPRYSLNYLVRFGTLANFRLRHPENPGAFHDQETT